MKIQSPGFQFQTRYDADGDRARIIGLWERWQDDAQIARGQEYTLRFWSYGGPVTIATRAHRRAAWNADQPGMSRMAARTGASVATSAGDRAATVPGTGVPNSTARTVQEGAMTWPGDTWGTWEDPPVSDPVLPPPTSGGGGGGGGSIHVRVRIKLFAPGIPEAVQEWELDEQLAGTTRFVTYDPPGFPTLDAPIKRAGWWRCTVTPIQDIAEIYLSAESAYGRAPFRESQISARLFRNVFRVAFDVVMPVVKIENTKLKVTAAKEMSDAYGGEPVTVEKDISPITGYATMKSLDLCATSGHELKSQIASRHDTRTLVNGPISDDDVVFYLQAAFTDTTVSVQTSIVGFDVARLHGDLGEMYLQISREFNYLNVVPYMAIDFSTIVSIALPVINLFKEVNSEMVNTAIAQGVNGNASLMLRYVREGLGRAMDPAGVVDQMWWSNKAIHLRYFIEPTIPAENAHWYLPDAPGLPGHPDVGVGPVSDLEASPSDPSIAQPAAGSGTDAGAGSGSGAGASTPNGYGVFPDGFVVDTAAKALELLDRHDSLVFIMMENRSFDHLLGGLASAVPRAANDPNRYDGPPTGSSNPLTDGLDLVPVVPTTSINMGTVTPVCPHHNYEPTAFQIRDGVHTLKQDEDGGLELSGTMQGFTRSIADRTDSPQLVMMQYQQEQLPTYYELASSFKVCDRWFAAHPGPTWPNRYATVCGHIPALDNFPSSDPRIGFLRDHTIWDTLTSAGIDWRVYESDLSLVRTFNTYRLNDTHVVRFDDPHDGFEAMLRSGAPLPRVMFVEPNFSDLPPVANASDDLAPADLAHGQAFIRHVYDLIRLSGKAPRMLLAITYDEHGGFWDHVPPPGTAKAATIFPEYADGAVAPLIENGPTHLGVRVPGFVVSSWVSGGEVSHTVFDHTSILKTILVHNRQRISTGEFARFGPRVAKAHHLGMALDDLEQRREKWPELRVNEDRSRPQVTRPTHDVGASVGPLDAVPTVASDGSDHSWAAPEPTVIYSEAGVQQPQDRGDFHSGLRDMMRPRAH